MRIYKFKYKKSYYVYDEGTGCAQWINNKLFFNSLSDMMNEIQYGFVTQEDKKEMRRIELDSVLVAQWKGYDGLQKLYPEYFI